jgi:hypothetical protein
MIGVKYSFSSEIHQEIGKQVWEYGGMRVLELMSEFPAQVDLKEIGFNIQIGNEGR